MTQPQTISHPITTDLIALWRLDEAATSNAIDVGPWGFTGVKSANNPGTQLGTIATARSFGDNAFFTIADAIKLKPAAFTVAFWIKILTATKPSTNAPIVKKVRTATTPSFVIQAGASADIIQAGVTTTEAPTTLKVANSTVLSLGWHHVAVTFDGAALSIYTDGVLNGTNTSLGSGIITYDTPGSLGIGADPASTADYTPHHLDDIAFYEQAKSLEWITRAAAITNGPAVRAYLETLYVDDIEYDTMAGEDYAIINTVPEHLETGVRVDAPISLQLCSLDGSALATCTVTIQQGAGVPSLAYDQDAGGIQAGWDGPRASATLQPSLGGANNDELLLILDPTTPLASLAPITITWAADSGAAPDTGSYTFTTEDAIAPRVDQILWLNPRTARLRNNKPYPQADANVYGTRYFVNLAGGLQFTAPNLLSVPHLTPTADWIGYYVACTGSYPQNNGYHAITAVSPANKTLTVDATITTDNGIDADERGRVIRRRDLRATITPYRLEQRTQDETEDTGILVAYEPIITSIKAPEPDQIPTGDSADRYVIATFHDDVSIRRRYRLHTTKVRDILENVSDSGSYLDFTTPLFFAPADRIQMWDILPEPVRVKDLQAGGELRKLVVVLQDMMNVLWYRSDAFERIWDIDQAPTHWLPYLLYHMGNPFELALTEKEKRKLATVLVDIYRRVGTEDVIEDVIAFFLGIQVTVQQFISSDWWVLGTDKLGTGTILGPGDTYSKNTYEILSSVTLTEEQRRRIRLLAEYLDPFNMHLLRIVEP